MVIDKTEIQISEIQELLALLRVVSKSMEPADVEMAKFLLALMQKIAKYK